jgi:hypothetical protein
MKKLLPHLRKSKGNRESGNAEKIFKIPYGNTAGNHRTMRGVLG